MEQVFFDNGTFYTYNNNGVLVPIMLSGGGGGGGRKIIKKNGFDIWSIPLMGFNPESSDSLVIAGFFSSNAVSVLSQEGKVSYYYNNNNNIVLKRFSFKLIQIAISGGDIVATVRKNGNDTPISITIPSGSTEGSVFSDNINSVNISQGDSVSVMLKSNGATGLIALTSISIIAEPV